MHVLVLGGTVFAGRHLVKALLARGHDVTLFNRGRENPHLFRGVRRVIGDRARDIARLGTRHYDVVYDTCGYLPAEVGASARWLADHCDVYVFLSSLCVYRDLSQPGTAEDSPLCAPPEPDTALSGSALGSLKVGCEQQVLSVFGVDRMLTARCGLLMGPYDVSSRARRDVDDEIVMGLDYDAFSARIPWWPLRVAQGGRFVAPGSPDRPLQLLDVRDLAAWLAEAPQAGVRGIFNAAGPTGAELSMGSWVDAVVQATGAAPGNATWVSDPELLAAGCEPFTTIPLWVPTSSTEVAGFYQLDVHAAHAAGLTTRPVAESVADILAWAVQHPGDAVATNVPIIKPELELALLRRSSS